MPVGGYGGAVSTLYRLRMNGEGRLKVTSIQVAVTASCEGKE
jgi:hypothetical protein